MRPVDCAACGAVVTARKSSWDQTSVQWTAESLGRCRERAAPRPTTVRPDRHNRPNTHGFPGCAALSLAVREAAVLGLLEVHSHEPLKRNPEASS
jgi:hypothetical protein